MRREGTIGKLHDSCDVFFNATRPDKGGVYSGTWGGMFIKILVGQLLIGITLGIATPWVICSIYKYVVENTTFQGKKVVFEGKGGGLFGTFFIVGLLTGITFGIYYLLGFANKKIVKWFVARTKIEGVDAESTFDCDWKDMCVHQMLPWLLPSFICNNMTLSGVKMRSTYGFLTMISAEVACAVADAVTFGWYEFLCAGVNRRLGTLVENIFVDERAAE